jgi:hypothetical protein
MSSCSRAPLTPRRRAAVIVASIGSLAATTPLLLRHTGSSDWSDAVLGGVVGIMLGISLVLLVVTIRRSRSAP